MFDKNALEHPDEYMKSLMGVNKKITGSYDESKAIKCPNGTFVGEECEGILSFKGIPYAYQPVGDRRWKDAVLLPETDEVFEAKYFGKTSVQPVTHHEISSLYLMGEECLNLNIWTDKSSVNGKKAVMMFIHGGAFMFGGAVDPTYDGQEFIEAHRDVVLVTISYRVGILGFADLEKLEGSEEYKDSCNFGLTDQIAALKWIQRNISAFGGDPDNVTIFGESAGGGSVSSLCLVPAAKGLFRRIIAESGAIGLTFSREYMRDNTALYFESKNIKNMADALALNWEELVSNFQPAPMRDTKELPYATLEESYEAFKTGFSKDLDIMTGTNNDESRYFIFTQGGEAVYKEQEDAKVDLRLSFVPKEMQPALLDIMTDENGNITVEGHLKLEDDVVFHGPSFMQAEKHAEGTGSGKTYVYGFTTESHIDPKKHGGFLGACHGVELTYVFGTIDNPMVGGPDQSKEFSDKVQEMWTNFAKTGDPSIEGFEWPQFNSENWNVAILDDGKYGGIRLSHDFKKDEYLNFKPYCCYNIIEAGL